MFLSSSFHLFLFCTQGPHAKNERVPPEFFCISEFLIQTSTVCNNEMSIFFSFIFTLFLLFKSEIKSQSIFRVERYLLSSENLISFAADISDQKSKCKQIKGSDVPQDQNGFLNTEQSAKGILDAQLHMLAVHLHS